MSKYRKKPVVIDAFQYDGDMKLNDGRYYVPDWAEKAYEEGVMYYDSLSEELPPCELFIQTLEGRHHVSVGDYIICGVKGELYPCKPDIFEHTYTLVDEETERACKGYKTGAELEAYDDGYFDGFIDGLAESRSLLLEIIDRHISSWSGKQYGDPNVMAAIEDLRRDVLALKGDK